MTLFRATVGVTQGGDAGIKRRAPRAFAQGARESSSDLLSRARGPGTIGDEGLDFRVRKGNGYDPLSVTAETISSATTCRLKKLSRTALKPWWVRAAHATDEPNRRKKGKALPGY